MRASAMEFGEFCVEDSSFILLKRDCTRDNFFKFFGDQIYPLKKKKRQETVKKRPVT